MAQIKCPECQKDVSAEADVCPYCGYSIKMKAAVESEPTPNLEHLREYSDGLIEKRRRKVERKKKRPQIFWLILSILSVGLCVAALIRQSIDKEAIQVSISDSSHSPSYVTVYRTKPVYYGIVFCSAVLTVNCIRMYLRKRNGD